MKPKPIIDRSLLHPEANRAVAMDLQGNWLSYSITPMAGEAGWIKQSSNTVCFRIPAFRAPDWTGDWTDSLLVFESVESPR